jgi:hypothetical protein
MEHKVLPTGVHCITDSKGVVHVYTESEYQHLEWWIKMKIKYKLN